MKVYFYNGQITNYFITTEGKLYNEKTKNWLKGQISKNGYLTYNISIEGIKKRLYAHRMVAETYIPFIEGKTEVNHIDGNKLNNSVENLEWVISSENKVHAIKTGLKNEMLTKVYCFDKFKNLVCCYESVAAACQVNHFNASWLFEQLNRSIKTLSHGYYWSRTSDNNFETKKVELITESEVYDFIAGKALSEEFGARNIQRYAEEKIASALIDEMLFGSLTRGGKVKVSVENGEIKCVIA